MSGTIRGATAALVIAGAVGGQAQPEALQTRLDEAAGDALELRRVARDADAELRAAVVAPDAAPSMLAAAPYLDAAEELLPALVEVAAGDDPERAPVAGLAAWKIARGLDIRELGARETAPPDPSVFDPLAADESARPDLRRLGQLGAEALRQLRSGARRHRRVKRNDTVRGSAAIVVEMLAIWGSRQLRRRPRG